MNSNSLATFTPSPRVFVTVCAWCPDKAQRDAEAEAAGHVVTHGLCPDCYAAQMRQIRRLVEIVPETVPLREPVRFSCRLRNRAQLSPI